MRVLQCSTFGSNLIVTVVKYVCCVHWLTGVLNRFWSLLNSDANTKATFMLPFLFHVILKYESYLYKYISSIHFCGPTFKYLDFNLLKDGCVTFLLTLAIRMLTQQGLKFLLGNYYLKADFELFKAIYFWQCIFFLFFSLTLFLCLFKMKASQPCYLFGGRAGKYRCFMSVFVYILLRPFQAKQKTPGKSPVVLGKKTIRNTSSTSSNFQSYSKKTILKYKVVSNLYKNINE